MMSIVQKSSQATGGVARRGPLVLTKHHGLGNDFLVAVGSDLVLKAAPELARRLCHRHRGIGADGLMFVDVSRPEPATREPATLAPTAREPAVDGVMILFNADGSRAEMSGNGARCLGQALAMAVGVSTLDLLIDTDAGRRALQVRPHRSEAASVMVRVAMGPVGPGPHWQASPAAQRALSSLPAFGAAGRRAVTASIGNPHLIIEVEDPWSVDLGRFGPLLEADFLAGINVEFIAKRPGAANQLDLTVWERGSGITEACGTGASAAATIAHRWGLVGPEVTVHMPGGMVEVVVGASQTELIGPSTYIAQIEIDLG